jgi:general secretion pathway protein L
MKLAAQGLGARFVEFWNWWRTGLGACIPERVRTALHTGADRWFVEVDGARCRLGNRAEGARVPAVMHEFDLDAPSAPPAGGARAFLRRAAAQPAQGVLVSRRAMALSKELTLPIAVEANLRGAIELQLDRLCPYRTEEIYLGVEAIGRDLEKGRVYVRFTVAPRAAFDAALQALGAWGLRPALAECFDQAGAWRSVTLKGTLTDVAVRRPAGRVHRGLVTLTVSLALGAPAVPFVKRWQAVAALEAELEIARAAAQESSAILTRLQERFAAPHYVVERRQRQPPAIEIVNELARTLPDDAWLQGLEVSDVAVNLQGDAQATRTLVEALERARRFRNPTFRAPVQSNAQTGAERFSLGVELVRGADR